MRCTLEFNYFDASRDIREVEVCDCPSLSSIIESGVVPASASDASYNDVEDTSSILGRVEDVFQSVQLSRDIKSFKARRNAVSASNEPSVASSDTAPVGE